MSTLEILILVIIGLGGLISLSSVFICYLKNKIDKLQNEFYQHIKYDVKKFDTNDERHKLFKMDLEVLQKIARKDNERIEKIEEQINKIKEQKTASLHELREKIHQIEQDKEVDEKVLVRVMKMLKIKKDVSTYEINYKLIQPHCEKQGTAPIYAETKTEAIKKLIASIPAKDLFKNKMQIISIKERYADDWEATFKIIYDEEITTTEKTVTHRQEYITIAKSKYEAEKQFLTFFDNKKIKIISIEEEKE